MTTKAGTFDTFKIEATEQQVQGADASRHGDIKLQFWYAPTVNRWVRKKVEFRIEGRLREAITEELTEYARKP